MKAQNDTNTNEILYDYYINIRDNISSRLIKLENMHQIEHTIVKNKENLIGLLKEEDILLKIIKKNCKKLE
jgi:hypothetical protein